MIPLDVFCDCCRTATCYICTDDPRATDCFCGVSVENKFSLFFEQRCILYPHSMLQLCYCFGLILMKLKISNVSSPNDSNGAFTRWNLIAFICSLVWSFRMYGIFSLHPSISSWQTTKRHGIVATINCFCLVISQFVLRPEDWKMFPSFPRANGGIVS
jgi:hypothetical protein